MWKFFLGPALLGAACIAGSIYGADAEQIVHKQPSVVYSAVELAIANSPRSGTMQFDEGPAVPYEVQVDRTPDQQMIVRLLMNGKQGAETLVTFAPRSGGKDTLIAVKVHTDHSVLRQALSGTSKAKLALAPDWVFNITIRSVLGELAEQIERGGAISDPTQSFVGGGGDAEAKLTAEQREQMSAWQQYDAARPTVDPNEAAQNYLGGGGS